jgi:hypothetical protein
MDFPSAGFMDEDACYEKLVDILHPDGFTCPRCRAHDGLRVHRRDRRCGRASQTADGLLRDAQGVADLALRPAMLLQEHRRKPPPLTPVDRDGVRCFHPPLLLTGRF